MSYESYTNIFNAVKSELNRKDITDSQIAQFIRVAEKRCYRDLRIPPMEVKALLTTVGPDYENSPHDTSKTAVPKDWLETISITDEYGRALESISQQQFRTLPIRAVAGDPMYFCREHLFFRFWPNIPEGEKVVCYYYKEPDAGSTTNEEPEAYHMVGEAIFYGAVAEGWRFVREPDKVQFYAGLFAQLLQQQQALSKQSDISGSTLISKNPYA